MSSDPVFATTGQALFVSYLMEVLPAQIKSPTQMVIDELKRRYWRMDEQEAHTLNLAGLSPREFHDQCSNVRGRVLRLLTAPEQNAIHARYSMINDTRNPTSKPVAVRDLCQYLRPLVALQHDGALLALAWSLYAPVTTRKDRASGRKADWTIRKISDDYGIPKSTLADSRRAFKLHSHRLEQVAEDRLDQFFRETGLVGEAVAA